MMRLEHQLDAVLARDLREEGLTKRLENTMAQMLDSGLEQQMVRLEAGR